MKNKILKKLSIKKSSIAKLENTTKESIKGGATEITCNSVPRGEGGIGCHLF